jgi:hypothetical protein
MTYEEDRELLAVLRELMRDVSEHRYVKDITVERNHIGKISKVVLIMREDSGARW